MASQTAWVLTWTDRDLGPPSTIPLRDERYANERRRVLEASAGVEDVRITTTTIHPENEENSK